VGRFRHTKKFIGSHKEGWRDNGDQEVLYELWKSKAEYYEVYPLKTFRDKVYQEFWTAKYLHTLEVRGRDPRLYAGPDSGSSSGADD